MKRRYRKRKSAGRQLTFPRFGPGQAFLSDPEPAEKVVVEARTNGRVVRREFHVHVPIWMILDWAVDNGDSVTLRRPDG